jgi:hypothetical protein
MHEKRRGYYEYEDRIRSSSHVICVTHDHVKIRSNGAQSLLIHDRQTCLFLYGYL